MEEEEVVEDYGVSTGFEKVLNPSDGISIDSSNPLCPRFSFEEKEMERLMKPFGRTLVVKLLGRQPSYGFMVKKLRQIWERKGNIDIFDLENDFYLVSFQHSDDYMEALTGGPWVINDAYLNVARWCPEFSPKSERIESVVAWVRFPDLPAPLFDKKFLLNLGNVIGKAIKLDVLSVVYESLGLLCNKCGYFGHVKEVCEDFHRKCNEERMEWPRRQTRVFSHPQSNQNGSRFSVLSEGAEVEDNYNGDEMDKGKKVEVGETGRVQGDELAREQRRQGKAGNIGEGKRTFAPLRPKNVEVSVQDKRKVKEGKVTLATGKAKGKSESTCLKEPQNSTNSCDYVPESNLELYRANEMNVLDKENMHPGDQICKEVCNRGLETGGRFSGKEELYKGEDNEMSIENVYATPVLAD
ncbi:hypothetical protein K1719_042086 [Acacia pycnantha]|nr:hypothetical protein K1719_042086 [Acacia pycnantha]